MANTRHTIANTEGASTQMLSFKVTNPTTVASVSGPQLFTSDVTLTARGTGRTDISISNFKGPVGVAHVFPAVVAASALSVPAGTADIFITTAPTYSGDTLSFSIGINSGGSGFAADWHCLVLGI